MSTPTRQPQTGSSPRARGTRNTTRLCPPANAVHPRVRGERWINRDEETIAGGSSPRARGTPIHRGDHRAECRFIPACAGNAWANGLQPRLITVHPRVRGERILIERRYYGPRGSSPRARGTPRAAPVAALRWRFIPACAGNATLSGLVRRPMTVHPRVRGERPIR